MNLSSKKKSVSKTADKKSAPSKTSVRQDDSKGQELLAWAVTPMQKDPRKARMFIIGNLLFVGMVVIAYGDILWVGLTVLLLTVAFHSYIFPSRYRLTTVGVEQKITFTSLFKPWTSIVKFAKAPDGVQLYYGHSKMRNRLNPGPFIYFGKDNSSAVLSIVEKHVNSPERKPLS